eukprot:TRINITY_DN37410_c0_g1_i1.p1 TRINITY_DN37410_c0_g1~~TRINITY_DN37410_c0_g1_i1.p1  ORF type:complete len:367 (+),score=51.46 TRINITY_DN37410_c0_g1_i1:47-1102(+)
MSIFDGRGSGDRRRRKHKPTGEVFRRRSHILPLVALTASLLSVLSCWCRAGRVVVGAQNSVATPGPGVRPPLRRRVAALLPGLGLGSAGLFSELSASAEEVSSAASVDTAFEELEVYQSESAGLEIGIPKSWKTVKDLNREFNIVGFQFLNKKKENYASAVARNFSVAKFLKGLNYEPSEEDAKANSWAEVIKNSDPPLRVRQIAKALFKPALGPIAKDQKPIYETLEELDAVIQNNIDTNSTFNKEGTERACGVVDAKIEGSVITFHVRYAITRMGQEQSSTGIKPVDRYYACKAIISKGNIKIVYVTTPEANWEPDYKGSYPAAFFERIVSSLKVAESLDSLVTLKSVV